MDLRTKSIDDSIVLDEEGDSGRLVEYHPGNGTRYLVLFQCLDGFSKAAHDRIGCGENAVLMTTLTDPSNQRAVVVHSNSLIHWSRMERLTPSLSDQVVLAELAGFVLGCDAVSCEEFLRDRQSA